MRNYKKTDPRRYQLNLSLTEYELKDINKRAEALGMRPVHFARIALLNGTSATTRRSTPADQTMRQIRMQLGRLGSNLNQAVRRLHENCVPLPLDLEPLLHDIRELVARIPR
jgi:hypothetical protein